MPVILRRPFVRLHRACNRARCVLSSSANVHCVDCDLSSHLFRLIPASTGQSSLLSLQHYELFQIASCDVSDTRSDSRSNSGPVLGLRTWYRRTLQPGLRTQAVLWLVYAVRLVCTWLLLARGRTGSRPAEIRRGKRREVGK